MSTAPTVAAAPAGRGVSTGEPDLWCTYAAVRTLVWLDRTGTMAQPEATAAYVAGRRNADGGYAWSRGMLSDAWATFYCTEALGDLGQPLPRPEITGEWLASTWTGDAYAMLPGQTPDVWATHFSARTSAALTGSPAPAPQQLGAWLGVLQCADGGLSWSPDDARRGKSDARACYYGVMAWRAAAQDTRQAPPWDLEALTAWLRARQDASGGFRFSADADVPCMWATYRAVGALAALGAGPREPAACVDWVLRQRGPSGAFVRWQGYDVEDVWASFCAIGTLTALGAPTEDVADAVATRIEQLRCAQGGYTYREPEAAADALTTAAAVLTGHDPQGDQERVRWLEGCQLPNEGGVMYMPGRGSEIRCTLWALAAGAFADDPAARAEIADWLGRLQNPDGGFGYWEGRGSDMVSTTAALECAVLVGGRRGLRDILDTGSAASFLSSCRRLDEGPAAHGNVPGATATLRAGLQAQRGIALLGEYGQDSQNSSDSQDGEHGQDTARTVATLLERHRVRGGGFANEGHRMPDLLSTYEAVLAADRVGLAVDTGHIEPFLHRTRDATGTAWTPMAPGSGGPLANCLGTLLARRVDAGDAALPPLALS